MNLTRREFLISLGATGVTAVLKGPQALAEAAFSGKAVFSFAVVSDTHLGKSGKRQAKSMSSVVTEINESPAEFTFFLGDLVNNGTKNEGLYPQWKKIADQLKKPYYPIQGNHDPADLFKKHIREETDYVVDHGGYRFILFNDSRTTSHLGFVSPEQIKWIGDQIDEAGRKGMRSILAAHVASHKNLHPDVGWWINKKGGGVAFNRMMSARRSRIAALFSGHFHCGMRGWHDRGGIHEVVFPSLAWNNNRGLEKAPGWCLQEHRLGYVQAEVFEKAIKLSYKPVSAEVKEQKELALKAVARR